MTWRAVCSCSHKNEHGSATGNIFACWGATSNVSRSSPWRNLCILLAHDVANRACTHHRVSESKDMWPSSRNLRWILAALDILTRLAGEGKLKSLLDLKPIVVFTLVWKVRLDLNSCLWICPGSGLEPKPEDVRFHSQGEGSQTCLGMSSFSQGLFFLQSFLLPGNPFDILGGNMSVLLSSRSNTSGQCCPLAAEVCRQSPSIPSRTAALLRLWHPEPVGQKPTTYPNANR